MATEVKKAPGLLSVSFNQDFGCFAVGTTTGFRIYNCADYKMLYEREIGGGIGQVAMLHRSNILALVGGGTEPRFAENKVVIWDDNLGRTIGELCFRQAVKAVKLRRDRVVVVLETRIYVYNFADLSLVDWYDTVSNPDGICALCPQQRSMVLAFPGAAAPRGYIVRVELYDKQKTTLIPAHEHQLGNLALNSDGSILATCSLQGTLVRTWNTQTGAKLQELRRGKDAAFICSLAFHHSRPYLAASSDRGTQHIFSLDAKSDGQVPDDGARPRNAVSNFSFMSGILPAYFSSQWSFAQYKQTGPGRTIVCFDKDENILNVVSEAGIFHKARFDPEVAAEQTSAGYECTNEFKTRFFPPSAEPESKAGS